MYIAWYTIYKQYVMLVLRISPPSSMPAPQVFLQVLAALWYFHAFPQIGIPFAIGFLGCGRCLVGLMDFYTLWEFFDRDIRITGGDGGLRNKDYVGLS